MVSDMKGYLIKKAFFCMSIHSDKISFHTGQESQTCHQPSYQSRHHSEIKMKSNRGQVVNQFQTDQSVTGEHDYSSRLLQFQHHLL